MQLIGERIGSMTGQLTEYMPYSKSAFQTGTQREVDRKVGGLIGARSRFPFKEQTC